MTQNHRRRAAFTLVEMLVASALIIFMMYIIASAFEAGLASFRVMKVQGDMQDKLRAAATAIRLDLTAQHFGDGSALSDQRLNDQMWQPPAKGYFRISQPGTAGTLEGVDPDNSTAQYYRLTPLQAQNLYMQFTVNLTNGHPSLRDARARSDQFFSTDNNNSDPNPTTNPLNSFSSPDYNVFNSADPNSPRPSVFTSYWAEVTYFVKPISVGPVTAQYTDSSHTVPIYNLYRRVVLIVDSPTKNTVPQYRPGSGNYSNVSSAFAPVVFNRPGDVTEPARRWSVATGSIYGQTFGGPFPTIYDSANATTPVNPYADPLLGQQVGGDLLLTNVINFDIKVMWEPVVAGAANSTRFIQPTNNSTPPDFIPPNPTSNPDYPFDTLPVGVNPGISTAGTSSPRVFDTWSSNTDTSSGQTYNYGPPITGPMLQQEYGAWNGGHFSPLPASGATPPSPSATQFSIPLRVRVRGVQIKLRIWDPKSSQTRQMTIIQDL